MNETDIKKMLDELGYDYRWIDYGFLSFEEVNNQYLLYKKAKDYPDSKEAEFYGYQHSEHLRHETFLKISEKYKSFTDEQLEKLIELVEIDEDQIMALNFYRYIIEKQSVTEEQIKKLPC